MCQVEVGMLQGSPMARPDRASERGEPEGGREWIRVRRPAGIGTYRLATSAREVARVGSFRAIGVAFLFGYFFFGEAKKK